MVGSKPAADAGKSGTSARGPFTKSDVPPAKNMIRRLSGRERQIAALIWQGLTYKQIASLLQISPGTVRTYVRRIFQRLAIFDRTMLEVILDGDATLDGSMTAAAERGRTRAIRRRVDRKRLPTK